MMSFRIEDPRDRAGRGSHGLEGWGELLAREGLLDGGGQATLGGLQDLAPDGLERRQHSCQPELGSVGVQDAGIVDVVVGLGHVGPFVGDRGSLETV